MHALINLTRTKQLRNKAIVMFCSATQLLLSNAKDIINLLKQLIIYR